MAKNTKTPVPDFEKMGEEIIASLPSEVAELAKSFFRSSFDKEGFTDYGFVAWPKRKDNATHPLLFKSHALKDSIKISSAKIERVEVTAGEGIPYAAIHNTGGHITVRLTEKSRKFFWYMYKSTGNTKWKWMALAKKNQSSPTLTIKIPKRKYIGDSQELNKSIHTLITDKIVREFGKIKT